MLWITNLFSLELKMVVRRKGNVRIKPTAAIIMERLNISGKGGSTYCFVTFESAGLLAPNEDRFSFAG